MVKIIGTKTLIVVSVEAMIAPVTCFVPCTAARGAAMPRTRRRTMFSSTTMELSTSIPMPRARPLRVMMFSDSPVKYISTSAKSTLSGMLTPTTIVGRRSFRNSARITMARMAPSSILWRMLLMMMVMYLPWSSRRTSFSALSRSSSSPIAFRQFRLTSLVPAVEPL